MFFTRGVAGALLAVSGSALWALDGSGVPALPQPPNGLVTLGSGGIEPAEHGTQVDPGRAE